MRLSKLAAYLIIILLIQTCYSTEPDNGDPPPPPGYQEDIPWPSLADSPWPMNRGNPQGTGRSKFPGPRNGNVVWEYEAFEVETGISLDENNTSYFVPLSDGIHAVNEDGNREWFVEFKGEASLMTPILSSDGSIYAGMGNILYSTTKEGMVKWEYKTDDNFEGMVNLGIDGTIYIVDRSKNLYSISPEGDLLWRISDERFNYFSNGIVFSPDGSTLYIPGSSVSLIAFDVNNKLVKWTFGTIVMFRSPLVDSQGNIYLLPGDSEEPGTTTLYSLTDQGVIRWSYNFSYQNYSLGSLPTIDKLGNIYYGVNDTLFSLNYSGLLNWKVELIGKAACPLVCDDESNIYVGTDGQGSERFTAAITKINSNGELLWRIVLDGFGVAASPSIGNNSRLYLPPWKWINIYCIN
jgi:hypothetical protein